MIMKKFRIDIFGDLEYNDLIADIYYEDRILAVLTQEEGFDKLRILIYPSKNTEHWDFNFNEFDAVINQAKKRLWELRIVPE